MGWGRFKSVACISVMLICIAATPAPTTKPAIVQPPPAPVGKYEQVALRVGNNRSTNSTTPASTQPADAFTSGGTVDYQRVALALGIVIGLIFVTRWAGKK